MNIFDGITHVVGLTGVVFLLIAFLLLNTSKVSALNLNYQLLNFFGSAFILYSLFFQWNLSAALIEIAWMMISLIGIVRSFRYARSKNKT